MSLNSHLARATCTGTGTGTGLADHIAAGQKVKGNTMAATIALVIALVVFIAGAVAGVLVLVSWGIRREERDFTLTRQAPGQLTQGTRRVTGLWVRQRSDIGPMMTTRSVADRHSMLV